MRLPPRSTARVAALLSLVFANAACVLPALVGGTTIAADQLDADTTHFALENEVSRNLLAEGRRDANGELNDAYWISSDLSLRRGITPKLGVEATARFSWALPLPLPAPIGLTLGAIYRLESPTPGIHLAMRAQANFGGISITNNAGGVSRTESAGFGGATLSALGTFRLGDRLGLAFTAAPFVRVFGVNHKVSTSGLDRSFVAPSFGISGNLQLRLWILEVTPMGTLEVGFSPTDGAAFLVPMGGVSAGLRF